jgi:ribulose-5-phosphate 4-epimerase/fuculose-1-phosphate aldolase
VGLNPPSPSGKIIFRFNVNGLIKLSRAVVDLVNPLDKTSSTVRDILIPTKIGKEIYQVVNQIHAKGLTVGNLGEISFRTNGSVEKFVINCIDSDLENLNEKDLCLVDIPTGKVMGVRLPAKHFEFHREVYRKTNANAVLLCHPPAAMVCGFNNNLPNPKLWPEIEEVSAKLGVVENNLQEIILKIETHQFLIIKGVGLLVQGMNMKETFWNTEIIERFCQISILNHEGK